MNRIKERIKKLEQQAPTVTDETVFNNALDEVLKEATTQELMIAVGSGKYGKMATPEQQKEMCTVFIRRAKAKVLPELKSR